MLPKAHYMAGRKEFLNAARVGVSDKSIHFLGLNLLSNMAFDDIVDLDAVASGALAMRAVVDRVDSVESRGRAR
jgi:hypothetical protein